MNVCAKQLLLTRFTKNNKFQPQGVSWKKSVDDQSFIYVLYRNVYMNTIQPIVVELFLFGSNWWRSNWPIKRESNTHRAQMWLLVLQPFNWRKINYQGSESISHGFFNYSANGGNEAASAVKHAAQRSENTGTSHFNELVSTQIQFFNDFICVHVYIHKHTHTHTHTHTHWHKEYERKRVCEREREKEE